MADPESTCRADDGPSRVTIAHSGVHGMVDTDPTCTVFPRADELIVPQRILMPTLDIRAGEGRRWLVATALAIVLESSLLAAVVWYAQQAPEPLTKPHPSPQPIQVFMAAALPVPVAAPSALPPPVPVSAPHFQLAKPEADVKSAPSTATGPDDKAAPPLKPAPTKPMLKPVAEHRQEPNVASKPKSRPESPSGPGHESRTARRPEQHRARPHVDHKHARPSEQDISPRPVTSSVAARAHSAGPLANSVAVAQVRAISPSPPALVPLADLGDLIRAFGGQLSRAIQGNLIYPPAAQAMGQGGRTLVQFQVVSGQIRDVRVRQSSGSSLLDEAAVRAVQTLPCPKLPGDLAHRTLPFTLWVRFDPA